MWDEHGILCQATEVLTAPKTFSRMILVYPVPGSPNLPQCETGPVWRKISRICMDCSHVLHRSRACSPRGSRNRGCIRHRAGTARNRRIPCGNCSNPTSIERHAWLPSRSLALHLYQQGMGYLRGHRGAPGNPRQRSSGNPRQRSFGSRRRSLASGDRLRGCAGRRHNAETVPRTATAQFSAFDRRGGREAV